MMMIKLFNLFSVLCLCAEAFALRRYVRIVESQRPLSAVTLGGKLLCSACFCLAALFACLAGGEGVTPYAQRMLIAFGCAFLGDLFLHCWPKLGNLAVNYGLGGLFFLGGHVLFALAFYQKYTALRPENGHFLRGILLLALALDAVVIAALFLICRLKMGLLALPIALYAWMLLTMCCLAFSVAAAVGGGAAMQVFSTLTLRAGAALFAASDLVLCVSFFRKEKDLRLQKANLYLYYIGQCLLALSLLRTLPPHY